MVEHVLDKHEAETLATELLAAVGVPEANARITARHMVEADLRGVETHGLALLPRYLERLREGHVVADAQPSLIEEQAATAAVDGGDGLGQVNSDFAMGVAIAKAKEAGVGAVSVRRSHHFGAGASYVAAAAEARCVGIALSNAAALMAPTGGAARRVGNNPMAIGAPSTQGFPVILDMALSTVAAGRIKLAVRRGQRIPPEWSLDKHGEPTTDPNDLYGDDGMLRPLGDHKGFGLAVLIDVLTGVLSGAGFGTGVKRLDQPEYLNTGHFFIAVTIEAFLPFDVFQERFEQLAREIYDTPKRAGVDELFLPGEIEARRAEQREREGLTYDSALYEPLADLARQLGVHAPSGTAG